MTDTDSAHPSYLLALASLRIGDGVDSRRHLLGALEDVAFRPRAAACFAMALLDGLDRNDREVARWLGQAGAALNRTPASELLTALSGYLDGDFLSGRIFLAAALPDTLMFELGFGAFDMPSGELTLLASEVRAFDELGAALESFVRARELARFGENPREANTLAAEPDGEADRDWQADPELADCVDRVFVDHDDDSYICYAAWTDGGRVSAVVGFGWRLDVHDEVVQPIHGHRAYKEYSEHEGPLDYGCDERILNLLTPLDSPDSLAVTWRQRCRSRASTDVVSFTCGLDSSFESAVRRYLEAEYPRHQISVRVKAWVEMADVSYIALELCTPRSTSVRAAACIPVTGDVPASDLAFRLVDEESGSESVPKHARRIPRAVLDLLTPTVNAIANSWRRASRIAVVPPHKSDLR